MGARVQYCGHAGTFVADIFAFDGVNVVKAASNAKGQVVPVTPGNINRDLKNCPPTHHLSDFPKAGAWFPERGIFVVPENQVEELCPPKRKS